MKCSFSECSALTGEGIQNSVLNQIYECLKPVENFVAKFKEEIADQMDSRRQSEIGADLLITD
jgi:archaellum component FlaC